MGFLISSLLQIFLVLFILNYLAVESSAQFQAPDPKCYHSRAGLPACSFNLFNCYHEGVGVKPAWKLVLPLEKGPVKPYKGKESYVYLDPVASQSKSRTMKAFIAQGKKAICVEFYYATAGNGTAPIDISIENGDKFSVMHHVDANTRGSWKSSRFSCCLPNIHRVRQIAIKATSTEEAIVALDEMDIRMSDMPCENGQLACYPTAPSQAPLEPYDSSTSCPADEDAEANRLLCDFTSVTKDRPDTCAWHMSSGWIARQKVDGSGRYDTLYSTEEGNVFLLSAVSGAVGSVCVEIQFATLNLTADVSKAFTIDLLEYQGEVLFSGQAYNYNGSDLTIWKRNTFSFCLPQGQSWQMLITSNIKGLQLDYVHLRISQVSGCYSTTVGSLDTSVSPIETSTIRQTPKDVHAFTVENKQPRTSPGNFTTVGLAGVFSLIALLCLIMLVSLAAVVWECSKRRQTGLPLWPFRRLA